MVVLVLIRRLLSGWVLSVNAGYRKRMSRSLRPFKCHCRVIGKIQREEAKDGHGLDTSNGSPILKARQAH